MSPAPSSRKRYKSFVEDYRQRRLDAALEAEKKLTPSDEPEAPSDSGPSGWRGLIAGRRGQYLRQYIAWLWPHRHAGAVVFVLALVYAGLEMAEPLFMRFIIDRVLLTTDLDPAARLRRLHVAGSLFVLVVILSNLVNVLRDYRQRLLNTRVMLVLRRSLFDRLLHLPLPKLWDMKTGGILSRLSGDVDTTTGLLQMAIVSPSIALVRLGIAVVILFTLNWHLAVTALAIIPGIMLMSFASARRVRPIYRSLRKDVELIDGRVGETFSGIRIVRAFRREMRELLDRKSTRLNSSHLARSRMPSSA